MLLLILVGLHAADARADSVNPAECVCPSLQPVAVLEGQIRAVNKPVGGRAQLLVTAVEPAGAPVPYAPGDLIEVTQYVKSGSVSVGSRVLAPVFFEDFNGGGKTHEIADMLAFDPDGKITCSYAPGLRISGAEALRIIGGPVSTCYDEMVKLGVVDNFECDDTAGCMASVGGSGGGRPGGVVLLLVLCGIGLLAATRPRGA